MTRFAAISTYYLSLFLICKTKRSFGSLQPSKIVSGDLYQRFLVHSQAMLARPAAADDDLNAYLDLLFAHLLRRCVNDAAALASPNADRQVVMQPLITARLAGYLAGHVALGEDPLRKLMEAVMLGDGEAVTTRRATDHDHDRDHGHAHGAGEGGARHQDHSH